MRTRTTFASVPDAHKAIGELNLGGLPGPLAITIQRDYDNYTLWTAAVHVQESAFDEWFLSIGAARFDVRYRGDDDKYVEMFATAHNGVEVFCLVKKADLKEAQA